MSANKTNPTGAIPLETNVAVPEKAALSNVFASPVDSVPRSSADSSPRSYKSDNNPFDTDIEAMITTDTLGNPVTRTTTMQKLKSDCRVWPGQDHWQKRDKAAKKKRGNCALMSSLSPRNKIIAKIVIILLIVGIGVGVGFGVSKPLGAPIWGDDN